MKKLGYWDKDAKTVKSDGYIYNISSIAISDDLDLLAYHIEKNGYKIEKRVIDAANEFNPVTISLPTLEEEGKEGNNV